jgi:uncharacterized lipoprotein YbaY
MKKPDKNYNWFNRKIKKQISTGLRNRITNGTKLCFLQRMRSQFNSTIQDRIYMLIVKENQSQIVAEAIKANFIQELLQ